MPTFVIEARASLARPKSSTLTGRAGSASRSTAMSRCDAQRVRLAERVADRERPRRRGVGPIAPRATIAQVFTREYPSRCRASRSRRAGIRERVRRGRSSTTHEPSWLKNRSSALARAWFSRRRTLIATVRSARAGARRTHAPCRPLRSAPRSGIDPRSPSSARCPRAWNAGKGASWAPLETPRSPRHEMPARIAPRCAPGAATSRRGRLPAPRSSRRRDSPFLIVPRP